MEDGSSRMQRSTRRRPEILHLFGTWTSFLLLLFMVGCDGCSPTASPPLSKAKEEDVADRFVFDEFKVLPTSRDRSINYVKAGHWVQFRHEVKANKFDETLTAELNTVDSNFQPLTYRGSEVITYSRDVTIARNQSKNSEFLALIPNSADVRGENQTNRPMTKLTYIERKLGVQLSEQAYPYSLLNPEQYLFLVISREPARHRFWSRVNAIVYPSEFRMEEEKTVVYRVIELGEEDARVSLPNNLLTWTAISHLVLYDVNLEVLSDSQKQAIIDWLHFGGTILISGPDALASVSNSFLSPYLPLQDIQTVEASPELFQRLNDHWSIASPGPNSNEQNHLSIPQSRKLTILNGKPTGRAAWLSSAEGLVADRSIGAGRVCMTTFSMSDDFVVRWRCYGSFVNGALLRRPPREWKIQPEQFGSELVCVPAFRNAEKNGRFSTRVRIMSRDLSNSVSRRIRDNEASTIESQNEDARSSRLASDRQSVDPPASNVNPYITSFDQGDGLSSRSDPGRWNDNSGIAEAASQELSGASGIAVPRVRRIIQLLSMYLAALVPINWLIFRLIGRLEWAWVSAPLIAVVGALAIARSVQLDIGFTRSENRISVLELHQAHSRGHLATFTALYTSLSTQYDLMYPNGNGVVLPFVPQEQALARFGPRNVRFRYQSNQGDGLKRVSILSNTSSRFHGEECIEVGGGIRAEFDASNPRKLRLVNSSSIDIRFAVVAGKSLNQKWIQSWCGDLASGAEKGIELEENEIRREWFDPWELDSVTARGPARASEITSSGNDSRSTQLRVDMMLYQILNGIDFLPGHLVLIGYSDQQLSSLAVAPAANQFANCTIVVAHLSYPGLPAAQPDKDLVPLKTERAFIEDEQME